MLKSHERKLKFMISRFHKEDRVLHFAFFFASPLVLTSGSGGANGNRIKLMPQLNFTSEYEKIQQSINSAQV